jgi:hypothetical protein
VKITDNQAYAFEVEEARTETPGRVGKRNILLGIHKEGRGTKDSTQLMMEDIDLTIEAERSRTFYYYKRWVWMIFPWICLSVNKQQTFSELIAKCYSSNIRYLSVEEEKLITRHAIKIVMDSKNKKQAMLAAKNPEVDYPNSEAQTPNMHKDLAKQSPKNLSGKNGQPKIGKSGSGHDFNLNMNTVTSEIGNNSQFNRSQVATTMASENNKTGYHFKGKNIRGLADLSIAGSKGTMPKLDQGKKKSNLGSHYDDPNAKGVNESSLSSVNKNFSSPPLYSAKVKGFNISGTTRNYDSQCDRNIFSTHEIQTPGPKISKVNEVLQRSQFWEDRLANQSYKEEVKNILIKCKNGGSSLSLLKDTLHNYTSKEIELLERKNGGLIVEYNNLVSKMKAKRKHLDIIKRQVSDIPKENPFEKMRESDQLDAYSAQLHDFESKVEKSLEQKRRTYRIIEICELNQIQNEEWIRSLNFYLTNLRKAIKYVHGEIHGMEKEVSDYTHLCETFVKHYNMGVQNHMRLVQNIEKSLLDQQIIDKRIGDTNDLIHNSVLGRQARENARREKVAEKDEKEKVIYFFLPY